LIDLVNGYSNWQSLIVLQLVIKVTFTGATRILAVFPLHWGERSQGMQEVRGSVRAQRTLSIMISMLAELKSCVYLNWKIID
jgi:hypothetical protein